MSCRGLHHVRAGELEGDKSVSWLKVCRRIRRIGLSVTIRCFTFNINDDRVPVSLVPVNSGAVGCGWNSQRKTGKCEGMIIFYNH